MGIMEIHQERFSERSGSQTVDVLGKKFLPHVMKNISAAVKEQILEVALRVVEDIANAVEFLKKKEEQQGKISWNTSVLSAHRKQKQPRMIPEDPSRRRTNSKAGWNVWAVVSL